MERPWIAWLASAWLALASVAHAQTDSFEYRNTRTVSHGGGVYEDWSDELTASGHYEVSGRASSSARLTVHAVYDWRYVSPESSTDGLEDRTVEIDRSTRHYVSSTDLDEYDDQEASSLATWVWVSPGLAVGDTLAILDESFVVTAIAEPIVIAGASRTAIHVTRHGTGQRHDAYGDFTTTSDDAYWFDAATGLFLSELRVEHDVGTSEGRLASFEQREAVSVVDASYAPRVGPPLPHDPIRLSSHSGALAEWMPLFAPLGFSAVVIAAFVLIRRMLRPAAPRLLRGREIAVDEIDASATLPTGAIATTSFFAALLPHFVAVARRTRNRIWIARVAGDVSGIAIEDRFAGVASIFAPSPDVCEALRVEMHVTDFFSELRHGNLEAVIEATQRTSTKLPAAVAYNVLETYEVLERRDAEAPVYDTQVVTRLERVDRGAAVDLLTRVLGAPCGEYLDASLAEGDLAFVARVDDVIVGVGLATVAGAEGRLHTLAVDASHRNRGLGRELVRARVRAMMALGATRIVTEIAARNSASLENVRREGFQSVGSMYIETSRDLAPATTSGTVRR